MLLIYTHKVTPRLRYVTKLIFDQMLGIEIGFTTKVEDFIKHKEAKITYSKNPLQNEFFVKGNDLLFEKGINTFDIEVFAWDKVPCFFRVDKGELPFDIFSASFFLLSRYEEYWPHVKDELGRYDPQDSLAKKNGFLETPIVDVWAKKLSVLLFERFPDLKIRGKAYTFLPMVKVTSSHAYAYKGFVRNMGGLFNDGRRFKFRSVFERFRAWIDPSKDPYDNFDRLIQIQKDYKAKSIFFFQVADYSSLDKNVSIYRHAFRYLIKRVADYASIRLSASSQAVSDLEALVVEKDRLAQLIHRDVPGSRMRFNRIDLPATYRNLVEAEFTEDYSMGYAQELGFRAGTCTPFYFYDIRAEQQLPIRLYPFAVGDHALLQFSTKDGIMTRLDSIYQQVKEVKGCFITLFSNQLLGSDHKVDWIALYEDTIKNYHV